MKTRGSSLLVVLLLTISCGCVSHEKPSVDIVDFYSRSDTLGYVGYISEEPFDVRRQIDGILSRLLLAKSAADSAMTDSCLESSDWLISLYQRESGVQDMGRKRAIYATWDSGDIAIKLEIDSLYGLPDSLVDLNELRRQYQSIGDTFLVASICYLMANIHYRNGRIDSSTACCKEAISIALSVDAAPLLGDCYYFLGRTYGYNRADYSPAEEHYALAIDQFRRAGRRARVFFPLWARGYSLFQLNQLHSALRVFRAGFDELGDQGESYHRAQFAMGLGEVFYDLNMLDSSLFYARLCENLRRSITRGQENLGYPVSLQGLIHQAEGDYSRATGCYREAEKLFKDADNSEGIYLNLYRMASLAVEQEDYETAKSMYRDILAVAGGDILEWRILSMYGHAVADYYTGERDAAKLMLKECIDLTEKARQKLTSPSVSAGVLKDKIGCYNLLSTIYAEDYFSSGDIAYIDTALEVLERSKAVALIQSIAEEPEDPDYVEQEWALLDSISHLQSRLVLGSVDSERIRADLRHLDDSLLSFRLKYQRSRSEIPFEIMHSVSLNSLRNLLARENSLLIEYLLSDFGMYAFVADSQDISVHVIVGSLDSLESVVDKYLTLIREYPTAERTKSAFKPYAMELYSKLIPEEIRTFEDNRKLIIVPSACLHGLPFESLIDSDDKFLIENFDISYVPSIRILDLLRSRKKELFDADRILAFGNPDSPRNSLHHREGLASNGREADVDPVEGVTSLRPLPFSEKEINCIKSMFGDDMVAYASAEATESNLKRENFSDYRFLHFATHSIVNNINPERSSIVLSQESDMRNDGVLQPPEIARLDVDVDLVFLSACETGVGKTYPGEGSMNMARPFLVAGSNSVIVTSWKIDDRFSAEFVCDYYTLLSEANSKSLSLTLAKRALLDSKITLYHDPYFWAPFILVGLPD